MDDGKPFKASVAIFEAVGRGYTSIARNSLIMADADVAYDGAAYYPFYYNLNATDPRSASYMVVRGIAEGRERTIDLKGQNAKLTRTVDNMSERPLVEQNIIETSDEFDFPFYDVNESGKKPTL